MSYCGHNNEENKYEKGNVEDEGDEGNEVVEIFEFLQDMIRCLTCEDIANNPRVRKACETLQLFLEKKCEHCCSCVCRFLITINQIITL
jgi:hypothetical protein